MVMNFLCAAFFLGTSYREDPPVWALTGRSLTYGVDGGALLTGRTLRMC